MPYLRTAIDEENEKLIIKLSPHQQKFMQCDKRICVLLAGWQAGKSLVMAVRLAKEALEKGEGVYLFIEPTYKQFAAVLDKLKEVLVTFGLLDDPINDHKKMEKEILLNNGARVIYRSAEAPEAIKGFTAKAAFLDELQDNPKDTERVWSILPSRVAVEGGQIFLAGTMPSPLAFRNHWLYKKIWLPFQAGDPDIQIITAASIDNPYFPKEDYEWARKNLPPDVFSAEYEGVFVDGLVRDALLPADAVDAAQERWKRLIPHIPAPLHEWTQQNFPAHIAGNIPAWEGEEIDRGEYIDLAVDVAAMGGDRNVITVRWGNIILTQIDLGAGQLPTVIAGHLIEMAESIRDLGYFPRFWIDIPGIGGAVFGHLLEANEEVYEFHPQAKALTHPERYAGLKPWLGFKIRERLSGGEMPEPQGNGDGGADKARPPESIPDEECEAVPPIPQLYEQLLEARYGYDSNEMRLKIPKPDPSPDFFDSYLISLMPVYVAPATMIQIWT